MALANRDVRAVLMEAEAAVLRWDGYGMPPDGGSLSLSLASTKSEQTE